VVHERLKSLLVTRSPQVEGERRAKTSAREHQASTMISSPWSQSPSPIQAGVARIFMREDSEGLPVYDGAKSYKPNKNKRMSNESSRWISRAIWMLLLFCT